MRIMSKLATIRDIPTVTTEGIGVGTVDAHGPHASPNHRDVQLAREWLSVCAKHTLTIRKTRTSYQLKRMVQAWFLHRGINVYISNGAMIAACLADGYRYKRCSPTDPNVWFDLGLK